MNPEFPTDPRQALEASLTSLVLGELPPDQAEFLRRAIAQDAELASVYERLKQTIDLVRETEHGPTQQPVNAPEPLKLAEDRRQQLLRHFKTVAPEEFAELPRRRFSWIVPVGAAAALLVIVGAALLPSLARSKSRGMHSALSQTDVLDSGRTLLEALKTPPPAQERFRSLKAAEPSPAPSVPAEVPKATIVLPAPAHEEKSPALVSVNGTAVTIQGVGDVRLAYAVPADRVNIIAPSSPPPGAVAAAPINTAGGGAYGGFAWLDNSGDGDKAAEVPSAPRVNVAGGGGIGGGVGGGLPAPASLAPSDSLPALRLSTNFLLAGEGFSGGAATRGIGERFQSFAPANEPVAIGGLAKVEEATAEKMGHYGLTPGVVVGGKTESVTAIDPATGLPVPLGELKDSTTAIDPATGLPIAADTRGASVGTIDANMGLPLAAGQPPLMDQTTGLPLVAGKDLELGRQIDSLREQDVRREGRLAGDQIGRVPILGDKPSVGELYKNPEARANGAVEFFAQSDAKRLPELGLKSESAQHSASIVLPPAQTEAGGNPAWIGGLSHAAGPSLERGNVRAAESRSGLLTKQQPRNQTAFDYMNGASEEQHQTAEKRGDVIPREERRLDQLLNLRRALLNKLELEGTTDLKLPKTSLVEIVDLADAKSADSPTLGARFRRAFSGKVEKKARIKVERDSSDIAGRPWQTATLSAGYDPYFVQTENEVIQSEAILGKVVDDLKLDEAWARKAGRSDKLSKGEAVQRLKRMLDLKNVPNSSLLEIGVKSDQPEEAAKLANTIAQEYQNHRNEERRKLTLTGVTALQERVADTDKAIVLEKEKLARLEQRIEPKQTDAAPPKPATPSPIPQPEIDPRENAFSTFSLNVSDVSFKLAAASLEKGAMPEPASIRSEEFINAFDYRDPEPPSGVPVGFAWDRTRYPFAQNRDLLRFSIKTAAQGRQTGRPLNLVLLLDNSGSMERADRVQIIREALRVLASQLQPQDKLSVVTFARTAQLRVDGVAGSQAGKVAEELGGLTPQGGTNLEEAMNLAYQTARKHYLANGINRVVLLTDGAANLGDVEPENLKKKVEDHRKQGIALDCFGIGWEGYNDDLLEVLSRNGDGRYGFINSPEEASTEFAGQLAGALHVAASDVKVQVEFNPKRVTAWRQIGYAKHQLTKEQFRDNTVDAAEIGAAESGNALYVVEVNPRGEGALATVRVRYKIPGTADYHEHEWAVPYNGTAAPLEQSSPALRLAATASAFSEWLASSPYAAEITPDALLGYLGGIPEIYGADARPTKLEWMIRQAKSLAGK